MSDDSSLSTTGSGLATRLGQIARGISQRVPGGEYLRDQLHDAELAGLAHLKQRLDELEGSDRDDQTQSMPVASTGAATGTRSKPRGLRESYEALMDRSLNQTPESALEAFFMQLLNELVPDEARLLNVATGGNPIAVVHLELSNRKGTAGRAMAYLSRAGNEAGVMRNELTGQYLAHLQSMGLLDYAPADAQSGNKYDMIESDSIVRKTIEKVEKEKVYKARLVRESLVLSELGAAFLASCTGQ